MSQFNQEYNANGIMNEQYLDQLGQAFYNYCNVMSKPKLGAGPIVIVVLVGVIPILLFTALGESILLSVGIGAILSAVFAFLFWLAYRYRAGASKMFNSFLDADGGQGMYIDFASAQPFANDQFRLGRYYLFIKNGAVLRLDSITDIVRVTNRSLVGLTAVVKDGNGSMSYTLCWWTRLEGRQEIDEIRNAVMQRRMSV